MAHLSKQFFDRTTERLYYALVWGNIDEDSGTIEGHIGRSLTNRMQMAVFPDGEHGKPAITHFKVLERYTYVTLVQCKLETGRTHQIRVHLKSKGISLIGDNQYGKKNFKFKKINKIFLEKLIKIRGQALHAQTLEFDHPTKKKWVSFKTNVPDDFRKMLDLLNKLHS